MSDHICTSEDRLDEIDQEVHKQSGWLKAAAGFVAIAVVALGGFNGLILSKLSSIEAYLTSNQISIAEIKRDFVSLEKRVGDIERRHDFIDQKKK